MTQPLHLVAFFTNPLMLGWLAAAAAPLIIHLWNKRKYREVSWAAIDFLLDESRPFAERINGLAEWCRGKSQLKQPVKSDQDELDSAICALIGYQWRTGPRARSAMVGDLATGYMITPASGTVRRRLMAAARLRGVPVDGAIPL